MKVPEKISNTMVAICGMNCSVCYKHLLTKKYAKKCNGCKYDDETLPEHCRKCKIKDCANSKMLLYCFQCEDYPCKWIKNLDNSYKKRYATSLIANGLYIKKYGITSFLEQEKEKWTCSNCNGLISLHDKSCSECSKPIQS